MEFSARSPMPVDAAALLAWHAGPGAFERLRPPWQRLEVVERSGGIGPGDTLTMRMHQVGRSITWTARHEALAEGIGFADVQERGPFRSWRHEHHCLPTGSGTSDLHDVIVAALPGGGLAERLGGPWLRRELRRAFALRHRRTQLDLARHAAAAGRRLRVAVSGSSGLLGGQLVPMLTAGGHEVWRLVRSAADPARREIAWDPRAGAIDAAALEGMDAVIHLAGEGVADRRWTPDHLQRVRRSRVEGTDLLARTLGGLRRPPQVLVSASAVGWYGDRGDETVDEAAAPGHGTLAAICRAWEEAAEPARRAGIRVVHPRIGVVLAGDGGALASMLPAFRAGVGGPLGGGRQWLPWVAREDVLGALYALVLDDRYRGPVNLVAPSPVRQREFARVLGRVLQRPARLPAPAAALRLMLGRDMADELLLGGQRAVPAALAAGGFAFAFGDLAAALSFELGRGATVAP